MGLVINTNHLDLVLGQTRTAQNQQNEKRLYPNHETEHGLELVFDLSVVKELNSKTDCEEFPEQSCFCVKKCWHMLGSTYFFVQS